MAKRFLMDVNWWAPEYLFWAEKNAFSGCSSFVIPDWVLEFQGLKESWEGRSPKPYVQVLPEISRLCVQVCTVLMAPSERQEVPCPDQGVGQCSKELQEYRESWEKGAEVAQWCCELVWGTKQKGVGLGPEQQHCKRARWLEVFFFCVGCDGGNLYEGNCFWTFTSVNKSGPTSPEQYFLIGGNS